MAYQITSIEQPALPQAPGGYNRMYQDQHNNVLRLFFTRLVQIVRNVQVQAATPEVVSYQPTSEPVSPSVGDVYFDSTTNKLRCYDGTVWQDLF